MKGTRLYDNHIRKLDPLADNFKRSLRREGTRVEPRIRSQSEKSPQSDPW
jgi:hypothetical protein